MSVKHLIVAAATVATLVGSGLAYAGLNRRNDAVAAAQRGVERLPVTKDSSWGPYRLRDLGLVYAKFGEIDAALAQLDACLETGVLSIKMVEMDPQWAAVCADPSFQKVKAKYGGR